jgi:HSP20 family molecular chaperone IbpA
MFRTVAGWYGGNNSWYNSKYLELHDIIEWYNAEHLQEELLEDLRDIVLRHNKQEWSQGSVVEEENQTMSSEKQVNSEPFIPHYWDISATPKVGSKGRRKETKKFKKSPNNHLISYNSDDPRTYVYPDQEYEEKGVVKGKGEGDYPLEIIRSDVIIRITAQTPFVNDKNNIKVKIYDDNSIEISIDDNDSLQNNEKYYRIVEIPKDADTETAKCTYRNGILEITFRQKNR